MKHLAANTFQMTLEADPTLVEPDEDGRLQLSDLMLEWLADHIEEDRYSTWCTSSRYLIDFFDSRDGVFFKLAWSEGSW